MCLSDDTVYPPGTTALHIAILSENIQIINLLLSAGASLWIANQNGETALELAQKAKSAREIMQIFCNPTSYFASIPFRQVDFTETTIQLLKIFLDNGLDINQTGPDGVTLLFRATRIGRADCVRYLVSLGANVNIRVSPTTIDQHYQHNMTALHAAVNDTNVEVAPIHLIFHFDILKILLEAQADVNLQVFTKNVCRLLILQN